MKVKPTWEKNSSSYVYFSPVWVLSSSSQALQADEDIFNILHAEEKKIAFFAEDNGEIYRLLVV